MYTRTVTTPNGRQATPWNIPPGIRGRLIRVSLTSSSAVRVFKLRLWVAPLNDSQARWSWLDYPLEPYEVLPVYKPLPVPPTPPVFTYQEAAVQPTPPVWEWAPFPVNPTEPQWFTAKCLEVEETSNTWEWVPVPMDVAG
jgi:hypothetical protein